MEKKIDNELILCLYVVSTIYIIFNYYLVEHFSYIDEFIVVLLGIYGLVNSSLYKSKESKIAYCILLGYLIYSFVLHVNKPIAAVYDFVIFLKPFICFYVAYMSRMLIPNFIKVKLRYLYLFFALVLLIELPFIDQLYTNTTGYYQSCTFCAVSYLFLSDYSKKDWVVALLILTPGLFSIRAKFFTIYILFIFIAFLVNRRVKFNIKWIAVGILLLAIVIFVSREKILSYFVFGIEDGQARSFQYYYAFEVLIKYIPFGSGLGTYATEGAAKYYSPLYSMLGIDNVWGLREVDYNTNADFLKDTFYPVLAQFGIIGVFLFFLFWYRRWKEGKTLSKQKYKLFLFLFFVEIVQNIADNSFTGPFGVPLMILFGLILSESRYKYSSKLCLLYFLLLRYKLSVLLKYRNESFNYYKCVSNRNGECSDVEFRNRAGESDE